MKPMTIKTSAAALLAAAKSCSSIIPSATALPIIRMLRLDAEASRLFVTANNLETMIRLETECDADPGSFLVDAEGLRNALSALDGEAVLTMDEDGVEVSGDGFSVVLPVADADEFPTWESAEKMGDPVEIDPVLFLDRFKAVAFAVGEDRVGRPQLTGVSVDAKMRFAATSGRVAALYPWEGKQAFTPVILPVGPAKVIADLARGSDRLTLSASATLLQAEFTGGVVKTRLIDGPYPNIDAAVSTAKRSRVLRVRRDAAAAAIRKTAFFGSVKTEGGRHNVVHLSSDGETLLVESFGDSGVATASAPCRGGEGLAVALNAPYLSEAMESLGGEEIDLVVGDALDAVFVERAEGEPDPTRKPERFCIVMPLRVQKPETKKGGRK